MKLKSVRKSKRILFLFGLIISISLLLTGCGPGRPPGYSVDNPGMIPDGFGGIIVAYQINKGDDMTTYLQRLGADGTALWDNPGIVLPKGGGGFADTRNARLISDNQGNYIVIFYQPDGLWARKLDTEGRSIRPESSTQITTGHAYHLEVISDGAGGSIIGWADNPYSERGNIYLQRLDSGGNLSWDNDSPSAFGARFAMDSDGSGGVLMIWEDEDSNIFAQSFDSNGAPRWGEGLLLSDGNGTGYGEFDIAGDGSGGAVVVWIQHGFHLYAQNINADGETALEPIRITSVGPDGEETGSQHYPRITSNGSAGYFVFWNSSYSICGQRLDATGNIVSPESCILVAQSNQHPKCEVSADGAGGAVIVWDSVNLVNPFLRAQRLDVAGEKLWGEDGVQVSNVRPYWAGYSIPARISPDGEGGFFISWAAGGVSANGLLLTSSISMPTVISCGARTEYCWDLRLEHSCHSVVITSD